MDSEQTTANFKQSTNLNQLKGNVLIICWLLPYSNIHPNLYSIQFLSELSNKYVTTLILIHSTPIF